MKLLLQFAVAGMQIGDIYAELHRQFKQFKIVFAEARLHAGGCQAWLRLNCEAFAATALIFDVGIIEFETFV